MTDTGPLRRLRSRRVALVAAVAGAAGVAAATFSAPMETVATFADDVWAGAGLTAGGFGIQSAEQFNGTYSQTSPEHPFLFTGSSAPGTVEFTTPIALQPNAVSYARVFLRTTPGTTKNASVTLKPPTMRGGAESNDPELWNQYVTYGARAVLSNGATHCDDVFSRNEGALLYPNGTKLSSTSNAASTIPLAGAAGDQFMVCFRFTLDSGVVAGSPSSNGKSVNPMWEFNGVESAP